METPESAPKPIVQDQALTEPVQLSASPAYEDPIPPRTRLTACNMADLSEFTCAAPGTSETRWEKDVSDWIRDQGTGGALEAERLGKAEVYLYHEGPNLVGYGSIGKEEIWDSSTGILLGTVHVLPYLAVHSHFRRQKGAGKRSWGRRILGGLIEEVERRAEYPWLFLYVDPENPAKDFYSQFGFDTHDEWTDSTDGRLWVRMKRRITVKS